MADGSNILPTGGEGDRRNGGGGGLPSSAAREWIFPPVSAARRHLPISGEDRS